MALTSSATVSLSVRRPSQWWRSDLRMHAKDLCQGLANNHEHFQQEGDLVQWFRTWAINSGRAGSNFWLLPIMGCVIFGNKVSECQFSYLRENHLFNNTDFIELQGIGVSCEFSSVSWGCNHQKAWLGLEKPFLRRHSHMASSWLHPKPMIQETKEWDIMLFMT